MEGLSPIPSHSYQNRSETIYTQSNRAEVGISPAWVHYARLEIRSQIIPWTKSVADSWYIGK